MENSTLRLDPASIQGERECAQDVGLGETAPIVREGVWEEVLAALRARLGQEAFERWIAPIRVLALSPDGVKLEVDGLGLQQYIERRHLAVVRAVLWERLGTEIEVTLHAVPCSTPTATRAHVPSVASPRDPSRRRGSASPSALAPSTAAPSTHHRPSGREPTLESFVVGHSNSLAYQAVMEVVADPGHHYNPLVVYGGPGVGKTHLLKAVRRALLSKKRPGRPEGDPSPFYRVTYVTGEEFYNEFAASVQDGTVRRFREKHRAQDVLILDDVQLLVNKRKTQIELLHTFSSLFESGRQIILGSDVPPKALRMIDDALVCRFVGGLAVEIRKPDIETRLGIARAHAARLPGGIDDAALELIAQNVRPGAREIEGAMTRLRLHAARDAGRITVERTITILADILQEARGRIDLSRVQKAVAFHFGIAEESLVSRGRERHVAFARQVAMHLGRLYTKKPRTVIGKYFGKRDPSTVKSAEKKIEKLLRSPGGDFTREIEAIKARIED
jgi:chromosomal replication initiator protein